MNTNNPNLSDKQLKYSYWFLLHKKSLKKLGIVSFIVFDVLMILWAIVGLVKYLSNYSEFKELSQNSPSYIDWETYHNNNQPQDLIIGRTKVVKTISGQADIGVLITNPNIDWGMSQFTYQFVLAGGQTTPIMETWLLPNSDKYLLALSEQTVGVSASLQILDQQWQRIDRDQISINEIEVSDVQFVPASQLAELTKGGQVTWRVENRSAVSFWDVGWQVILYAGQNEVGFNYLQIKSLDSLASRELSVNWPESLSRVTSVRVIPDINLYDPSIIKN